MSFGLKALLFAVIGTALVWGVILLPKIFDYIKKSSG